MVKTYIHLLWYTFYGQFDYYDHLIMWALGLSGNGNFGNPIDTTVSWANNSIIIPQYFFVISGSIWNAIIISILRSSNKKKAPAAEGVLDAGDIFNNSA